jgi:carbonic anhydrase/acetyltransferase-like protein (isoleucine patch superfamily)
MTKFSLEGRQPQLPVGDDFWIAPDAAVVGDVRIGTAVSIWFGAVLRGDVELIDIGAGSNVQDLCVFHTDKGYPLTVGRNCTIGHRAILHGCSIGEGSLVGMGAIIMNGAVVGKNCLIGAGALVTEGTVIADGSLVIGSPAKVRRSLTVAEIDGLANSAAHYQANMRKFLRGLAVIAD